MALTSEDLSNITKIVDTVVNNVVTKATSGLATKSELKDAVSGLATKVELKEQLDRMESRLISSINLLQRDTFTRLDEHEIRIRRLEEAPRP